MSGSDATPAILGTSTTAVGVAVLPNTSGNTILSVAAIVMIVAGLLVTGSFIVTRVAGRFLR